MRFTRSTMAINWVKIGAWFEALGEAHAITSIEARKTLDWDTILKESQILRWVTRGEQRESMSIQQGKLERLTQTKMGQLVEEISNELPSLTEVQAPSRKRRSKKKSAAPSEMPELLPIDTSGDLFG